MTNQDQLFVLVVFHRLLGIVRLEHDFPDRRTGSGGKAFGNHFRRFFRCVVKNWEKQLFKIVSAHRQQCFFLRKQLRKSRAGYEILAGGHFDSPSDARQTRSLGVSRLEHPQLSLLDREFDVLWILVVSLQPGHDFEQVPMRLLPSPSRLVWHIIKRLGRSDTRHDVLTLRIDEVLAHRFRFAGRSVTREGDAGSAFLAHVTEDHGANIHSCAHQAGDFVDLPVLGCTL